MAIIQIISKPFFIITVGCGGDIPIGKERTEACDYTFGYLQHVNYPANSIRFNIE
jgi:hypothetical protein